jgi:NTP pyrophosphatase (non-canonical NTP hydrolase)
MGNVQSVLNDLLVATHENRNTRDLRSLYIEWINEEHKELLAEKPSTPNDMKELCDLLWVCIQYANACSYDLEKGMNELVSEYSSKFYDSEGNYNPQFRADGKLLKGTGFKKANFEQFFDE